MDQKEIAMNGAGVAELGFPMWPQFDPKTKQPAMDLSRDKNAEKMN